jgi:hypothetical protein
MDYAVRAKVVVWAIYTFIVQKNDAKKAILVEIAHQV